jgi:phosphatidylinositol kinase/protein kinase (PI-3  family)
MAAEHVMGLMRRNAKTLFAFLEIFVQDPITDLIWYRKEGAASIQSVEDPDPNSGGFRRAIKQVAEFDGGPLNEKRQVSKLIEIATSRRQLAQMYFGCSPFWRPSSWK